MKKSGLSGAKKPPCIFEADFLKPFEGVPSYSLSPEFAAVSAGLKPVLRTYAVRLERYPALKKLLARHRLFCEHSDFRISPRDDTALAPGGTLAYVYISRSAALAARAKKAEEGSLARGRNSYADSLEFSRLMGYPDCCFGAFRAFLAGRPGQPSHLMEYDALRNTSGRPSFYLNNLIRGGPYLISHFPCSYGCGPSLQYAAAVLGELGKVGPARAAEIPPLLKCPVMKFRENGACVRLIGGRAGPGGSVLYRDCGGDERLAARFRDGDSLRLAGNSIKIFMEGRPAGAYLKKHGQDGTLFFFE